MPINEKISYIQGLEDLIILKYPYCPQEPKESLQSATPIKIQVAFLTEIEKIIPKYVWIHKGPKWLKISWERRTKLEASCFLISNYIAKLW